MLCESECHHALHYQQKSISRCDSIVNVSWVNQAQTTCQKMWKIKTSNDKIIKWCYMKFFWYWIMQNSRDDFKNKNHKYKSNKNKDLAEDNH